MENKPKVICTKTYLITVREYDNNTTNVTRENNGLGIFELIGLMNIIIEDNKKRYFDDTVKLSPKDYQPAYRQAGANNQHKLK